MKKTILETTKTEKKAQTGAASVSEKTETAKKTAAEKKAADTAKAAPAEKKAESTVKAAPAEKKAESAVQAAPAEKKAESAAQEAAAEKKAESAKQTGTAVTDKKAGRSSAEKKAAAKEGAAKEMVVKEAAVKEMVYLQYMGREIDQNALMEQVRTRWTQEHGGKADGLKSIALYLKPEENAAYYVINDDVTGRIDM